MTADACTPAAPPRPSIDDFKAGSLYSTGFVARFFGFTDQWVRNQIKLKRLTGAKAFGSGHYLIAGESVLTLRGMLLLAEDAAGPPPAEVPAEKAARRALDRLAEMDGEAKPKAKKGRAK